MKTSVKEKNKECVCVCIYVYREAVWCFLFAECYCSSHSLASLHNAGGISGQADNQGTHMLHSEMNIELLGVAISQLFFSYAVFECACHMSDFFFSYMCVFFVLYVCKRKPSWKAVIRLKINRV